MEYHAEGTQKKVWVAILISNKLDFKLRPRREKDHWVLVKVTIQQEELILINICASNTIFVKQTVMDMKHQINISAVILRDLNIPLS